ncbi:hypothetical protein N7507_007299 [Penicillium longicatenatum]|nr:hypothetical protein N7507_007299 [Penicillium longicatenatum]
MEAESPITRPGPIKVFSSDGQMFVKEPEELFENNVHLPRHISPPRPLPSKALHYIAQQPLEDSGPLRNPISHHPRYLIPRSHLTIGTQRPSEKSLSSVDSKISGSTSDTTLSLPIPPPGSFPPYAAPPTQPSSIYGSCASPTSTIDLTSRTSIATELLFRQSTSSSSVIRLSDIPPFPPPWYPPPSQDPPLPQHDPRLQAVGLTSPLKISQAQNPDVQPVFAIPENVPNPRLTRVSLASSQAIPSSWGYGPTEPVSIIACLDAESGEGRPISHHHRAWLNATSVEKKDKPTIPTIAKSHSTSMVSILDSPPLPLGKSTFVRENMNSSSLLHSQGTFQKEFVCTPFSQSDQYMKSKKPPISREQTFEQYNDTWMSKPSDKKVYAMPNAMPGAAPTLNDKKPTSLNSFHRETNAVRDAEARSTTPLSLIDLIRSATGMSSSSEDGRSASRTDLTDKRQDFDPWNASKCHRNSGSFSDILAEFPPPGVPLFKGRGFLPISIWRSKRRNIEAIEWEKHHNTGNTPSKRPIHGLSRRQLIMICIVVLSTIVLAILLPVLLVTRSNSNSSTSCEKNMSCQNGGVSVSSGNVCSCICANGYTGTQCTTIGDSSCVTSDVTSSRNATMGSSLPRLFDDSLYKFGIALNGDTIMALFSTKNISCKAENTFVSFSGASYGSDTSKTRRSYRTFISEVEVETDPISVSLFGSSITTPRALATMDGILYDDSTTSETATTDSTEMEFMSSTAIALFEVVEFSQVAVLYILEETRSFESAVSTKETIQSYLLQSFKGTAHPSLLVLDAYDLDFENKAITLPDGTTIGGQI